MATTRVQLSSQTQVNADVDWNSFKLTSLADGTLSSDAVNKGQLDAAVVGLSWKTPVRVATTAAQVLATDFENGDTIDGIVLATNDRILIKDQAAGAENGIYTVNATGAPTRATDMDGGTEADGAAVFVTEGTANADQGFTQTTDNVTIGTTAMVWVQFTGAGSVPDASETVKGIIEIATQVETDAGTDDLRAVTPLKLANYTGFLGTALTSANIFVGNGSNVATGVAMSGDATIDNAGALTVAADIVKNADLIYSEALTVTHNNPTPSNLASAPIAGTVRVYLNGVRQQVGAGNDYTIAGQTITFTFNLKNAGANVDVVLVDYLV